MQNITLQAITWCQGNILCVAGNRRITMLSGKMAPCSPGPMATGLANFLPSCSKFQPQPTPSFLHRHILGYPHHPSDTFCTNRSGQLATFLPLTEGRKGRGFTVTPICVLLSHPDPPGRLAGDHAAAPPGDHRTSLGRHWGVGGPAVGPRLAPPPGCTPADWFLHPGPATLITPAS